MLKGRVAVAAGVILCLLGTDFRESVAEAGFVRQGVRPGEPGKVAFLRPPPPGTPVRIRPPNSVKPDDSAPPAEAATPPADRAPASTRPRSASHDWFWAAYSPAETAAGAGRWAEALATMQGRRARGQGIFSTEAIGAVRAAWGPEIEFAARAHGLSEALLMAVIAVESGGREQARSHKGAQGLMQLIPATAARFGVKDAFDPRANIAGGAGYLDWLLSEFGGDIVLALAGYNAGEGAVRKHNGVPPYAETRKYVVLVLDALAAAASLCDQPPAGPRTSCRWKPEI